MGLDSEGCVQILIAGAVSGSASLEQECVEDVAVLVGRHIETAVATGLEQEEKIEVRSCGCASSIRKVADRNCVGSTRDGMLSTFRFEVHMERKNVDVGSVVVPLFVVFRDMTLPSSR